MRTDDFFLLNVFTGSQAKGNQNCVLLLDDITDDARLFELAADFNMPATSFVRQREDGDFDIRWIAPSAEIHMCGHGTVGATEILTRELGRDQITFHFAGGSIIGKRSGALCEVSFQRTTLKPTDTPEHVLKGFGEQPEAYFTSSDKEVAVFKDPDTIRKMSPDWEALRTSNIFGYVITAPAEEDSEYDCVSRVMLPHISFLEDQATGSAHVLLAEYWPERLSKTELKAYQASDRGGEMVFGIEDNRVVLKASCEQFAVGRVG